MDMAAEPNILVTGDEHEGYTQGSELVGNKEDRGVEGAFHPGRADQSESPDHAL